MQLLWRLRDCRERRRYINFPRHTTLLSLLISTLLIRNIYFKRCCLLADFFNLLRFSRRATVAKEQRRQYSTESCGSIRGRNGPEDKTLFLSLAQLLHNLYCTPRHNSLVPVLQHDRRDIPEGFGGAGGKLSLRHLSLLNIVQVDGFIPVNICFAALARSRAELKDSRA